MGKSFQPKCRHAFPRDKLCVISLCRGTGGRSSFRLSDRPKAVSSKKFRGSTELLGFNPCIPRRKVSSQTERL